MFMTDDPTEISVPSSTNDIIVFPWDKSSKKYKRTEYSPSLTDGRATPDQVDDFLRIMDAIVQEKMSSSAFDASINTLKYGVPLGTIMYGIQDSFNFSLQTIVVLVISWITGWYLSEVLEKQRKRSNAERIKQELKNALEKKSLEQRFLAFQQKGLRWKIPSFFPQWIELHKDYKSVGLNKEDGTKQESTSKHKRAKQN